jgi:type IV pilus assembly protein PilY1
MFSPKMKINVLKIAIQVGFMALLALSNLDVAAVVPEVNIATGPLFSGRGNVHPNMLLNLSVEFPTVGAAYRGSNDYNKTSEYLGYFNPRKCYVYPVSTSDIPTYASSGKSIKPNPGSSGIPLYATIADAKAAQNSIGYLNGQGTTIRNTNGTEIISVTTTSDTDLNESVTGQAYFSITKAADANHECGGNSFSGNFMNWASSSSIDMLRYAMTGGDRIIDSATITVLQRAWLPDGTYNNNADFYASGTYFPRKSIIANTTVSAPNQVTPFNTTTLYVVSCRNRILFSNTITGGSCTTARTSGTPPVLQTTDKYFGEYLARVKVCDSAEGASRTDLCQKYGSNYKPEGTLQRYSDKIRVGALGYLTEHDTGNNNVYGGVVRGAVKYVGAKKFDAPSFSESVNDRPEWDSATGVFYNNPEDAANRSSTTNSGVINYLNKFGRTNTGRLGAYKTWDPVTELYYEAIRYLQGQQPTNGSSNGTSAIRALGTDVVDDNFSVAKTWSDPVTASCQDNYIVTIGDVNTHQDSYIPGSPAHNADVARAADTIVTGKTPAFDVRTWTRLVSDMEVDATGSYGNLAKRSNLANLDNISNTGAGTGTYYMAGLAYWANTNDIRLDKPVRVKTFSIDVDESGDGEIDCNKRGSKATEPSGCASSGGSVQPRNSQFYLAAKYGGFNDRNKDGNPFKTFASNGTSVLNNNTEWSANGTDPDNYFLASKPEKMIKAIQDIFKKTATGSGTIAGVTLTASKISTDSSYVYQPGFDSSKWSGSLSKLELKLVDKGTGDKTAPGYVPDYVISLQDAKTPTWDAGIKLTGTPATTTPAAAAVDPVPLPAARKIYTAKVEADGSLTTVPFIWDDLTIDQQGLLDKSPLAPFASDGLGKKRVNFLRGVRSDEIGQENGIFRSRERVLGDIINSGPVYVGAPASNVQGSGYQDFYKAHKDRTKAVYVGANDGMLHAFNAADGTELFAYVPNILIASLNQLTSPDYVHRPYVDGALTVAEAYVGSAWKTVLASGLGGGAQGVFVLDVTEPTRFTSGSAAIWEFTDKNDSDMGNLSSPPLVAKFKTGVTDNGVPIYKYFVVVPAGLNNYKDDGASNTTEPGIGALFLLSLDKKPGDAWVKDSNYYKFKTPIKDQALANGLSSPALVLGNDGAVRYAYAGDLQGNLWRFDFTDAAPWRNALGDPKSISTNTPLFTAQDNPGNRQPIVTQPKVVFAPGGGYVVVFGTGKFVESADAESAKFKTQSFYAIYDTTYTAYKVSGRGALVERKLASVNDSDGRVITGDDFIYGTSAATRKGWYLDYLGSDKTGERSVTNSLVAYGKLFFNTLIPGTDPCTIGGGRTYSLDVLTGLPLDSDGVSMSGASTGFMSEVGLLSSPVLFETGTDVGDANAIGGATARKKYAVYNFGTGGVKGTAAAAKMNSLGNFKGVISFSTKRISWREVLNWQELRDAFNK